jgi:hypothetical protein
MPLRYLLGGVISVFMESAGSASAVRKHALRFLELLHALNLEAMEVP